MKPCSDRVGSADENLAARVRAFCLERELFKDVPRVCIMVSGGQDSTTLLHLLACGRLGCVAPAHVIALHVNHHLRGKESDDDQALVEELCGRLGVELLVDHRPVEKGLGNVQERAREARRAAAGEAAARLALPVIALGHTMDDQVETLLYRLGRYGGLRSLRAMAAKDGAWVRPLLCVRRRETEAYCRACGLSFAVDRGNEYPGYARTGIREVVAPAWESVLPGAVEVAARAADVAGEAVELLDRVAAYIEGRCRRAPGEWSAARLRLLPPELRRVVIHSLLLRETASAGTNAGTGCGGATGSESGPEVSMAHVIAIDRLLSGPAAGCVGVGGGWVVEKCYDAVTFRRGKAGRESVPGDSRGPEAVFLPVPGRVRWGDLLVSAERAALFSAPDASREAYVDARAVCEGGLLVRAWRAGDRVRPLGCRGERKVQDVFTDAKVPVWRRRRIAVVESGGRIIWVAGFVVTESARIKADTVDIVHLSLEACEESAGESSD